ncbi:MAG: pyridoxal phosphate-dependent aminotransferase [bacterium]|nr:pyridoxal phosphate-dependent aminotransferase [bacterium]
MKISSRIKNMIAAPVDRINQERLRMEAEGLPMVNLGQAVPDFLPPDVVREKLPELVKERGINIYTSDPGRPDLREAVAGMLRDGFNVAGARFEEIIITAGANHAFLVVCTTLLEENDKVAVLSPYFLNHKMTVEGCGAEIIEVMPDEDFNYSMEDVEGVISGEGVRMLVVVNPSNPTGKVFSREELQRLLELCDKYDIWLVCDEVYCDFVYAPAEMVSVGSLVGAGERVIVFGSFSKSFGMTGWRVGWLCAPGWLMPELLKVQDYSVICAPHFSQLVACLALELAPDWPARHLGDLGVRRKEIAGLLRDSGLFRVYEGEGAFFLWLRPNVGIDSEVEVYELMERAGVCLMPGNLFGEVWRGWLRVSYGTQPVDRLREAARRLIKYFS